MSYVEKYIRFDQVGTSATGKTLVWHVMNKHNGSFVGVIKWYGGFRKYVFYPTIERVDWILLDAACMRLIADFLDEKNAAKRKKQ